MADDDLDLQAFAEAFIALSHEVHRLAGPGVQARSPLSEAIVEHLGVDPKGLPVVEQGFPMPDHPNIQLALEEIAELHHWDGFGVEY